ALQSVDKYEEEAWLVKDGDSEFRAY
nr:hypothetical protein [Tanacetum cinerariifolium]